MDSRVSPCPDCGGMQPPGASCRECFDALLAYEFERPAAFGAVHHLTVASYYLQHPKGYSLETLEAWREVVKAPQDSRRTQRDLLDAMSARFEGAKRVRDSRASIPGWWPASWPKTVRDAFDPNAPLPEVAAYVEAARAWAESVRDCLDRASLKEN